MDQHTKKTRDTTAASARRMKLDPFALFVGVMVVGSVVGQILFALWLKVA